MNIKLQTENLNSTYYRILFELAKEEGVESLKNLLYDLIDLESRPLGQEAILKSKHRTISLINRNKKAVAYLRKYRDELEGYNLLNPRILSIINKIIQNPSLLDTYLKNARILEKYRIGRIDIFSHKSALTDLKIRMEIYINEAKKITDIIKYYTDGEFEDRLMVTPLDSFNCQEVHTRLNTDVPATWILRTENHADGRQYRQIFITGFDFDSSKLPTEEELQSYNLPSTLKLQIKK